MSRSPLSRRLPFQPRPRRGPVSSGISPSFERLSRTGRQVGYVLLTRAPLYSGPEGPFRVRLACVRHAASVRSEPGSNSLVQTAGHGHNAAPVQLAAARGKQPPATCRRPPPPPRRPKSLAPRHASQRTVAIPTKLACTSPGKPRPTRRSPPPCLPAFSCQRANAPPRTGPPQTTGPGAACCLALPSYAHRAALAKTAWPRPGGTIITSPSPPTRQGKSRGGEIQ